MKLTRTGPSIIAANSNGSEAASAPNPDALEWGTTPAAKEGEILPAPPQPFLARLELGGDVTVAQPPAVEPAKPTGVRLLAATAPAGWIRDLDSNLWDAASVSGLEVVHEHYDGVARFKVVAHTSCGLKTLFLEADGLAAAEAYRDHTAARIGARRGHHQDDEHEDS